MINNQKTSSETTTLWGQSAQGNMPLPLRWLARIMMSGSQDVSPPMFEDCTYIHAIHSFF
jgi:hypothetical protein